MQYMYISKLCLHVCVYLRTAMQVLARVADAIHRHARGFEANGRRLLHIFLSDQFFAHCGALF